MALDVSSRSLLPAAFAARLASLAHLKLALAAACQQLTA
jgi:hypothetical protein